MTVPCVELGTLRAFLEVIAVLANIVTLIFIIKIALLFKSARQEEPHKLAELDVARIRKALSEFKEEPK